MKEIDGHSKPLKDLLFNTKYTVNYYQREYMWGRKQVEELIDDLTTEFLEYYNPDLPRTSIRDYGAYFMGSIVITDKNSAIIDGQQRLTSPTLLLMYLNSQLKAQGTIDSTIDGMIFSEQYGERSFNIHVDDREQCLNAIYNNEEFDPSNANESSRHIWARYNDIVSLFPDEIDDRAMPYFTDWLKEKVYFILITASSEQDAQKVFVSMNDRGLNLTSTEMLKGYLLSEINDDARREELNNTWKKFIDRLKTYNENEKGEDESFIKDWLRAQYAETIRETKAGSVNLDYDLIGTEFHKWVRENALRLGLRSSDDYEQFIKKMDYFCDKYLLIRNYCDEYNDDQRYVYYNARLDFTLQSQLLLAPICFDNDADTINAKIRLVSKFIDMYIYSRVINYKRVNYSGIKNYIFNVTKKIRNLDVASLSQVLIELYNNLEWKMSALSEWGVNGFTKPYIHHFLARITSYLERETDKIDNYVNYVNWRQKNPFEVEHITCDHYEWFMDEYDSKEQFDRFRNNIGDLLLLPKSLNASLNEKKYDYKVEKYRSADGNIYSESLHPDCYRNNVRFVKFINESGLGFKSYERFGKNEINEREQLVEKIASKIWNVDNLSI